MARHGVHLRMTGQRARGMVNQRETKTPDDLIVVATVSKPHGVAGALKVKVESHNPDRFKPGCKLLAIIAGRTTSFTVAKFVPQNDWGLLTLAEVSSYEQADALRGVDLGVPERDLDQLPPGCYYTFQIIGLKVESLSGQALGEVAVVEELPAGDAYLVRGNGAEFRVPANGGFIKSIDLGRGLMVIDDMEGLR